MKKKLLVFLLAIVLLAWFFLVLINKIQSQQSIHYHTGFLIYIDGILQDFSAQKYIEISAYQIEKAHLHDNVGDVVHVHQPGAT